MNSEVLKLKQAIAKNDIRLLEENPELLDYAFVVDGMPSIHLAVALNRVQIVKMLLKRNPELVNWGDQRVAKELAKLKVFGVKVPDETMLHVAARYCRPEVAELLLQHGADPDVLDDYWRTPLHYAASVGCVPVAELLLRHGADPNEQDSYWHTPLHIAAEGGHAAIVELLLKHGADPNAEGRNGMKPYELAHDLRTAYAFLRFAGPNAKLMRFVARELCENPSAFSPEYLDVLTPDSFDQCQSPELVKLALDRPDVAIAIAAQLGDVETVEKILVERPELASIVASHASTPEVLELAEKHYTPSAEELQELLKRAAARGHARLVAHLLDRGLVASCDMLTENPEVVDVVLKRGLQCDGILRRYIDNHDVLRVVLKYYRPTANDLCAALKVGAKTARLIAEHVESVDTYCLCEHLDLDVAFILVERGLLDPNTRCKGWPLLHIAASECHRPLAEALLRRGADVAALNPADNLAAEVACKEVLDLFAQ
ncbi:Ankyrin repeat protein [Pyrobaculum oguniense TE7]|uniref:Ankyrin repeat protein n=1 Tax=Pyrobaculum oguniense (strain DSM 13380 / JCM 10595 / TE7) TaxID=698757 RepID=H6QCW8_PYROT|nr:Ankyrin repeat protein [Pyrobaculum oguniense TE7]